MDVGLGSAFAVCFLALLLSLLVAWAEVGLTIAGRRRVLQVLEGDVWRAESADSWPANPARLLLTLASLRALAYAVAAGVTVVTVWRFYPGIVVALLTAIVIALFFLGTQVLARGFFARLSEDIALWMLTPMRWISYLLSPLTWLFQWLEEKARGTAVEYSGSGLVLDYDNLLFLLKAGEEQGVIEQEEQEMIASIFEFGETLVREVMVPRLDIVAIEVSTPLTEAVKIVLDAGHSRIPVYRDNIDNIVGLLYAKDLLRCYADGKIDVGVESVLRPAYFIPETKKVDELLQELQQRKVHMAIVVDEYGGTAGLVTIEDLLEEIVGEIQDEYDSEEPFVEEISESEFIFNARVDLDEVNKRLHIKLPSEGGDTLGGFIYSQLGKVPVPGDTVSFDGVTLKVLSVDGQRIERVLVRRETPFQGPDVSSPTSSSALFALLVL
ncbi:MAG: HlyC/CorC family transporter [Anaerolineae bacterium]|nr:HlyC/CorC family transporter [Anaerolineae bacterium]